SCARALVGQRHLLLDPRAEAAGPRRDHLAGGLPSPDRRLGALVEGPARLDHHGHGDGRLWGALPGLGPPVASRSALLETPSQPPVPEYLPGGTPLDRLHRRAADQADPRPEPLLRAPRG